AIEQEWTQLRQIHEAPVRELREQADTLSRLSVAATATSVNGFDRAEARLAAIETTLNARLTAVSDQLTAAVAEIRSLVPALTTAALVLVAAAAGWLLQRQASLATTRANAAEKQAEQVVSSASQQMAAVREESAKQIAEAKDASTRAQRVSDVLAAPDLV